MVEMPILAIILTTPLTAALMYFLTASLWSMLTSKPCADHVVERLERQVRIDGAATVADEQREMMHLARFAGFEHEADLGARALADQMMVQAGHGQQRRDGRVFRVHAAVGQNHDVGAVVDGAGRRRRTSCRAP